MRRVLFAAALAAFGFAAPASATTFTWGPGDMTGVTGNGACDATGDSFAAARGNTRTYSDTVSSETSVLKARGYSTNGSTNFVTAFVANWGSGGLGVVNLDEGCGIAAPNHALDNAGKKELLVYEFEQDNYDPDSVSIGYVDTDSDLEIYIGGSGAGLDFSTNICGLSANQACTFANLVQSGFTKVTVNDVASLPSDTVNMNAGAFAGLTGRYLIVATNSGGTNDHVKVNVVAGTSPTTQVPQPAALILFGLGLAGLGWLRRRAA